MIAGISGKLRFPLLLTCIALLAACAAVPRQTYNKEANRNITHITLVPPTNPEQYMVNIVHHPGLQFGLIGGLIAGAELDSKTNQFTELAKKTNVDLGKELSSAILKRLNKQQFDMNLANPDKEYRRDFIENYSGIRPDADAYLDITFRAAGYSAEQPSTPYIPTLWVPVRLVEGKTNRVLYSTLIIYGEANPVLESTNIPPDRRYSFSNFDDLTQHSEKAVEGLRLAIDAIANQISTDLK